MGKNCFQKVTDTWFKGLWYLYYKRYILSESGQKIKLKGMTTAKETCVAFSKQ